MLLPVHLLENPGLASLPFTSPPATSPCTAGRSARSGLGPWSALGDPVLFAGKYLQFSR